MLKKDDVIEAVSAAPGVSPGDRFVVLERRDSCAHVHVQREGGGSRFDVNEGGVGGHDPKVDAAWTVGGRVTTPWRKVS